MIRIENSKCLCRCVAFPIMLTTATFAADEFRKLGDAEIRSKLSGMEITDEVHWAELYNRDGTFTMWAMGRKTTGKWAAKSGELCLDNGQSMPDCREIRLSGNKVEFHYPGGGVAIEGVLRKQRPRD